MIESSKIARCAHGWPVNVGWTGEKARTGRCECCFAPCYGEDVLCGACARPKDFKEVTMECRGCKKTFTLAVVDKKSVSLVSRWCDDCLREKQHNRQSPEA